MAKDLINKLQEIGGTNPNASSEMSNGIYHDLVKKTTNDDSSKRLGKGIYGSIQDMYVVTKEAASKLLNLHVTSKQVGSNVPASVTLLEDGELNFVIPKGINGTNGLTPQYELVYDDVTGNLEFNFTGYLENKSAIVEEM